ncbi:gluconate 2-dehydrogenase subunit 3 family protein [Aureimonas altamirensis]|uniref:gluconate 2-dehydrogenase subunit 3 family protein n=1 Tax=Aureimonas altamirensis TaxID=370622 RepID=UPI0020373182|nr:gluconate 2-dehydrogenase subunit 3 family protein [Aureimonas altamirensis]MCM2502688.1 gluconate 2-dehydrogenase subunit 3 family protein [Aureimonas altamirensis]
MSAADLEPERRNTPMEAREKARLVLALVDELVPGDGFWPSASEAGVHGLVALRVMAEWDDAAFDRLARGLGWGKDGLSSPNGERRVAAVAALETAEPELFDTLRSATYLAYYETPFVIAAIQATGRPYSYRPHVTGYPMAAFDYNRDTPRHGRGHYLRTDEVERLDIAALDLAESRTERWGLER